MSVYATTVLIFCSFFIAVIPKPTMASVGGRTSRSNPGPAAAVTDLGPATSSIGSTLAAVAAAPVEGRTGEDRVKIAWGNLSHLAY